MSDLFSNPFRAGAGHKPPYLAGRVNEKNEFRKLLTQKVITDNLILTGLRGIGKTVLLEELKSISIAENWLWVGTEISESATISEENLANRIITDISVATSSIVVSEYNKQTMGFNAKDQKEKVYLGYDTLRHIYNETAGQLTADRLKHLFLFITPYIKQISKNGIIFAYDEAQNLSDQAPKEQFPLSTMLDVFQSIQRQDIPFMLVLTGLPTLYPKLVSARTYAERMFTVITLNRLNKSESRDAIKTPIETTECPVKFTNASIDMIYENSKGYPYFIQFICKEAYDHFLSKTYEGKTATVPLKEIIRKLDSDFFTSRWQRIPDRQRELLHVISNLENCDGEFSVQEITKKSEEISNKPFNRANIHQMITTLIKNGLVYRDKHGRYLLAVPMLADFIKRTAEIEF